MDCQDIYQTLAVAAVRGHALRTPGCVLPEVLANKAIVVLIFALCMATVHIRLRTEF